MKLAGALVSVGVLAAIAVGPGRVIYWAGTYLIPVVVILVVVLGTVGLLVRENGKVLDRRDEVSSTTLGSTPQQGEGFSGAVYWLLVSLFFLTSVAMTYLFWLVICDHWLHERLLVAGRFDQAETMRIPLRC